MVPQPPPPPQWVLDLNSTPPSRPKNTSIPDPPGFQSGSKSSRNVSTKTPARKPPTAQEMETLKLKKAWELAFAPAKQLPMNAFGMYMTGNSLQIFSIMMVFMLFKAPVQALLAMNRSFAPYTTSGTSSGMIGVKIVYVFCNCMALGLGIWKVGQMGLLPTTRSDWLAWEEGRTALEKSVPAWDL